MVYIICIQQVHEFEWPHLKKRKGTIGPWGRELRSQSRAIRKRRLTKPAWTGRLSFADRWPSNAKPDLQFLARNADENYVISRLSHHGLLVSLCSKHCRFVRVLIYLIFLRGGALLSYSFYTTFRAVQPGYDINTSHPCSTSMNSH